MNTGPNRDVSASFSERSMAGRGCPTSSSSRVLEKVRVLVVPRDDLGAEEARPSPATICLPCLPDGG
jgi:hypothetical protein